MPFKKLQPHEQESAETLIAAIERKDRRFRFFQTLFMIGTFVALMVIISGQQRTLDGLQSQLAEARQTADKQSKQVDDSQKTILRRLDCMTVFFSQRDRTNLTIQDVDRCTLNREGNPQIFFEPNEDGTTRVTPTPQNTPATPQQQPQTENPAPKPTVVNPDPNPAPISLVTPLLSQPICVLGVLCVQ